MTITFEIRREDLLAYLAAYNEQVGVVRTAYHRGFVWGPVAGAVLVLIVRPVEVGTALVIAAICTAFWAAIWYILWPSRLSSINRALLDEGAMANELGRHTITLDAEGIREVVDWGEAFRRWRVIRDVKVTATHVFVYTTGQGPSIASSTGKKTHPLPLQALPEGCGGSLLRRVGATGTQAHWRRGLGQEATTAATPGNLPPPEGNRAVSRLL